MMQQLRFRSLALSTLMLCVASTTACKDDGPGKLFEEKGTWALTDYALEGGGITAIDPMARADVFLLKFNGSEMAAASCSGPDGQTGVTGSTCGFQEESSRTWACRCFAYEFEDDTMRWQEYAPGEEIPEVGPPGGAADETGGEATGGSHELTVEQFMEIKNAYMFRSLPGPMGFDEGLMDSDGSTSLHVFRLRSDSLFEPTGCEEMCFGGG